MEGPAAGGYASGNGGMGIVVSNNTVHNITLTGGAGGAGTSWTIGATLNIEPWPPGWHDLYTDAREIAIAALAARVNPL